MTLRILAAALAAASIGGPAMARDIATLVLEKALDVPAEAAWKKIGGFCRFPELMDAKCTLTTGSGGLGTVRAVDGMGRKSEEIMVGQSSLSYTYSHFDATLHVGTLAVHPTGPKTSKIVYSFLWDQEALSPAQRKEAHDGRVAFFVPALEKLKAAAEAK